MFNWKKKIDDKEKVENLKGKQAKEMSSKQRQKERDEKIKEIGSKFKCHVCAKPSTKPTNRYVDQGMGCGYDYDDWDTPADLWQCKKCNKWTCKDHIHKGICKTCAEKM